MTFEEKLGQKAKESNYVGLDGLPDMISATILGEPQFKGDKRANECCYISLQIPSGIVIQKFGKSTWQDLHDAIIKAGGLKKLQDELHTWVKKPSGRATTNLRYFPTPNPTPKQAKKSA